MQKSFNTSGPNITERHYTLMREDFIAQGLSLVENERYFTIWAPRQTGKSTYFRLLALVLEKQNYKVAYINFENYKDLPMQSFLNRICEKLREFWQIDFNGLNIGDIFLSIEQIKNDKLVLIIDEVEGINPEYFGEFLHAIRNAYHSRQTHALKSVILLGVSNIIGVVSDNASPFNIADNLNLPYFSREEVFELLGQHETATGQLFSNETKEKIYYITAGQPGLVNGFALHLVEKYVDKKEIGLAEYFEIEKAYISYFPDKNVSNIINKGKKHRNFIERLLFAEAKIPFQIYDERIKELYVNGLITYDADGDITFHVPLYKKCLYYAFYPNYNGEKDRIEKDIDTDDYYFENGKLNFSAIISNYQKYAQRRGFRYFMDKDESGKFIGLRESALVYSFETYIQAFLGVLKGKSYLEPHVGLGRSDLIINVGGEEFVVECKVYRNITQFKEGKPQLAYYTKSLGLQEGIYLVFVENTVSNPNVFESEELFNDIKIKTYLVRYDLEKDF